MKVNAFLDCPSDFERVARYTLETLLDVEGHFYDIFAGSTFTSESEGALLYYGNSNASDASRLVIPWEGAAYQREKEPSFLTLNGIPVLYMDKPPSVLSRQKGRRITIGFDLIAAAFWLLSRQEEWGGGHRDRFNRFQCQDSWLMRHGLSEIPILNLYAMFLTEQLKKITETCERPLIRKAKWPGNRRYAVVLSHDVDSAGHFHIGRDARFFCHAVHQRSLRALKRATYSSLYNLVYSLSKRPNPLWNFDNVMNLEAEKGFRSTFNFTPDVRVIAYDPLYDIETPRMRALLNRLVTGGWEVGVHGSFDSYRDADLLHAQKEKLQNVIGGPAHGVRQHYLRLLYPETLQAQMEAGFKYDSTIGYRTGVGFRAGAAFPFYPYDPTSKSPLPILELPLTIMDGCLFWQLKLSPDGAVQKALSLLNEIKACEGLCVLLWHQRVYFERRYPGWWYVYKTALQYLKGEDSVWVATTKQVHDWWTARKALSLKKAFYQGGRSRYTFQIDQAIDHLALEIYGLKQRPQIHGVAASSKQIGISGYSLIFDHLRDGQTFEINWER